METLNYQSQLLSANGLAWDKIRKGEGIWTPERMDRPCDPRGVVTGAGFKLSS